ncbi:signal recognition particle-docking protein FtsY [Thiomicrospira microaerophila]|uniref:signal recognition particle-docking protein FtsY n=1 Tax=Thiomicrospira microaerophila TaxID=406020 RepID=UPI00200FD0FC|nr:signal recognition particle-docking protein FtsY [Thiomicrospira microaerophila]UQB41847.1 signal recognition particle-docking protein FtsY [Thiomicrospira microaerophila]
MFGFFRKKDKKQEVSEQQLSDPQRLDENTVEPNEPASSSTNEAQEINQVTETTLPAVPTAPEPSATSPAAEVPAIIADKAAEEKPTKLGLFARLKNQLTKTRQAFSDGLANLILGKKEIDQDLLDDLEMLLLTADVGVDATDQIIQNLTDQVSRKELKDPQALIDALKQQLADLLTPVSQPLVIDTTQKPFVILMVGVNGVGKTTTIGKLAKKFQQEGKSVMLAAGDTFRAAAVEQLQTWGERNHVPVIAQGTGADSAAVIFDAIQSAKAKKIDVLIADTAGRLHTQSNLMEELKKVRRVIQKVEPTAPHEVMLVLDAGTGQNALSQAKQFNQAMQLSGLVVSKLDGTAKGGIIFSLAQQLHIPVRYIGVGEKIDDLRTFNAQEFTEALFAKPDKNE